MKIKDIYTGQAIGGGRRAVIHAPKDAQDGSLYSMAKFLREKGLEVHPGYDENHVLRVGGFKDDDQLRELLTKDFPKTNPQTASKLHKIEVDSGLSFLPMGREKGEERKASDLHKTLRRYSTSFAGLSASISSIALLWQGVAKYSAALKTPDTGDDNKAILNILSASCFVAASALLTVLGYRNTKQPSMAEILRDMEPQLDADFIPKDIQGFGKSLKNAVGAMERNPWLVATAINGLGTIIKVANHLLPEVDPKTGVKNYELAELGASLFSFVSLGLIATAPKRSNKTLMGMEDYLESPEAQTHMNRVWAAAPELRPKKKSELLARLEAWDPIENHSSPNMRMAGVLSAVSNVIMGGYGIHSVKKGLNSNDPAVVAKAQQDAPLSAILPANLASDYFTSISKPGFSYGLDEVSAEVSQMLYRRHEEGRLKRPLMEEVYLISELLATHPAIASDAKDIREMVTARLDSRYGLLNAEQLEAKHEEKFLKRVSPWTKQVSPDARKVDFDKFDIGEERRPVLKKMLKNQISSEKASTHVERATQRDTAPDEAAQHSR